jgi:hypothetical protein
MCQLASHLSKQIDNKFIDNDLTIAITSLIKHISNILEATQNDDASQEFDKYISSRLIRLWNRCIEFVEQQCINRDDSHGLHHMMSVTRNALLIILYNHMYHNQMLTYYDVEDVITIAMLHDVADHKYDLKGHIEPKVKHFLKDICGNEKTIYTDSIKLWTIIDNISFSKEKAAGSVSALLCNANLAVRHTHIRNIVSDADRLEAIGKIGVVRCIQYTRSIAPPNTSESEIKKSVVDYANKKLYILLDYFHTEPAKIWSKLLYEDTILAVKNFVNS